MNCWNCEIDTKKDTKLLNLIYKLDGKETNSVVCSKDSCLLAFQKWIYHHKLCNCSKCIGLIIGLGCSICGQRIKHNAKWEIDSYINIQKQGTLQLFCSEQCKNKQSKESLCGKCGEAKATISCQKCKIANYCSQDCQSKDLERHSTTCKQLTARFTCSNCEKMSAKELSHCAGCYKTYYCSTQCQKEHWKKGHKSECTLLRVNDKKLKTAKNSV